MVNNLRAPIISVVMSVFSEPIEWISQSINSILNQTFGDFEFIIVNDNPLRKENIQLLDAYSAKDKRVKIVHNEKNLGLPCSLNRALSFVHGKYVARMDADDISLPNRFNLQYEFLEKNVDYGICGTYARFIDEHTKIGRRIRLGRTNEELKAKLLFYSPFMHPSIMARSNLICRLRYDENYRVAQDVELWLRMSKETKFYNIPKILLYYRVHQENSRGREKKILQQNILETLAGKRFEEFVYPIKNDLMKNLFARFYVQSNMGNEILEREEVFRLFSFLLRRLGNNRFTYNVIFQSYVYDLHKTHSYWEFFYNPFIRESVLKYMLCWGRYLRHFC